MDGKALGVDQFKTPGRIICIRYVFSDGLAAEAAVSTAERRGALPHPAQLAALLLRRAVGHTDQHLVQQSECTVKKITNNSQVSQCKVECFVLKHPEGLRKPSAAASLARSS